MDFNTGIAGDEEIHQSSSVQAKDWFQAYIPQDFECFINFAFGDVVLGLQRW
jgi:hypothetical protein